MRIRDCGVKTADAPLLPNDGAAKAVAANLPPSLYVPPKYRIAMATVVYNIPRIPTNEKGARLDRFFMRQRGSKTRPVTPNND